MASADLPRKSLSARQVRALAHPLRLRMLELLRAGPATASALARELGESSGATSYHLRELAKAGFVEDEPERGNARDRWWKRTTPLFVVAKQPADDAEYQAALGQLRTVMLERDEQALVYYLSGIEDEPLEWQDASFIGAWRLQLTLEEMHQLSAIVLEAVDRMRRPIDQVPPDARSVHFTFRLLVQPDPARD